MQQLKTALISWNHPSFHEVRFGYHEKFLEAEITRWDVSNTWTELLIEAAICAMHYGDRLIFENVWRKCTEDTPFESHGLGWRSSTSSKVIEALLGEAVSQLSAAHLEWDTIFILQRYLTSRQLFWTLEHSPTCKSNPRICQILWVVILASNLPVRDVIKSWIRLGLTGQDVRPFDLTGDWKASVFGSLESFLAIHRFRQVNVIALMDCLVHISELLRPIPDSGGLEDLDEVPQLIYFIVDTWNKYGQCFSVGIFENDNVKLLEWTINHNDVAAARALIPLYREYLEKKAKKIFQLKWRSPAEMRQTLAPLLQSSV